MACHETAETRPQNPTAHDLYDQTIYLDELIRQQTEQGRPKWGGGPLRLVSI
jgi:hypothetical protein